MIVWLASYPRCGNTLLRQVLQCCFAKESCDDLGSTANDSLVRRQEEGAIRQVQAAWGHRESGEDPQAFYEEASRSAETVFVKTHGLPTDNQPAIYIVRDGRLALESFLAYQEHYHPGESTFLSLLLGDHPFGGWSDHYRRWQERPGGRILLVRFEELVDAGAGLLARLAAFIGHEGAVRPWVNPQARLRQAVPACFREGRTCWSPGPSWTDFHLRLFFSLHGRTMVHLGYATQDEAGRHAFSAESGEAQLIEFARAQTARRWDLQRDCEAREACIQGLRAACDARLELIHRLDQTCKERLGLIQRLSEQCEQRVQQLPAQTGAPAATRAAR